MVHAVALRHDSTLGDLASHDAHVSGHAPGSHVAALFDAQRDLPGLIVLLEDGSAQVISRQSFFQLMSLPFGRELYLCRQIRLLLDVHQMPALLLPWNTPIADAARAALKRPANAVYEPLLIGLPDGGYRLIDVHAVLLAQTELLAEAQVARAHSEKFASLGQIAAGIAHEINNPLAFVSNNLAVIERDCRAVRDILSLYGQGTAVLGEHAAPLTAKIAELAEQIDLPYTLENLPDMLARSREGIKRIERIICDLRDFVRLDEGDFDDADLNAGVVSTVRMVQSKANDRDVILDLDLQPLPPVACFPAKINQVVMNLVVNGIDACVDGGRVTVATRRQGSEVCISVQDTGIGIDPAIGGRIFDPFFTTKPVGSGTGLGLSISYGIIRDHGGRIDFNSSPGHGSTFQVHLPASPGASRSPVSFTVFTDALPEAKTPARRAL